MTSSSKDRGNPNSREDCQIHVDKEGESCVIKIESIGQEKMLKELLGRFNSLKSDVNQLVSGQQKSPGKDMTGVLDDMSAKLKPLEDQLQKVNKHVGDDHVQLNKKFDEIKQDLTSLKDQQKQAGLNKDMLEKILQKLEQLDKILRNSHEEGQKRLSSDFQNFQQQMSSKNDYKPLLDAIQNLQTSFDKEKSKPDILARKLDSIDQKLKESQPEHMAMIKDIQTKLDPLHKVTPQTSETLTKINDRVKAMHADASKSHPDLLQKLDQLDQQMKNQPNVLIEPIKQILNPLIEQQNQTKKAAEDKLGENQIDSPNRVPLCVNGVIPVSSQFSDPHVLHALAEDIAKKLNDIQTKIPSIDQQKRKQDDLLGNINKQQELLKTIDSKMNYLTQNDPKKRSDQPVDMAKEISTRTEPLHQAVENLSKQQQPLVQTMHDLPKKLDEIRQSQISPETIKELSSKFEPLTQSIKAMHNDLNQQNNQILKNIDQKFADANKRPNTQQEVEKSIQPFSQMIKTLRDSIDQSQAQQQNETKNLEQRLSKTLETTPKTSELMDKLNEINKNIKQTDPNIEKLSHDVQTIKNIVEKQPTPDDILEKITQLNQKQKAPFEAALKDIHSKVEPLHQASRDSIELKKNNEDISKKIDQLINPVQNLNNQIQHIDQQFTNLTKDFHAMGDLPKQIDFLKDALEKLQPNQSSPAMKDIADRLKTLDETMKGLSKSRNLIPSNEDDEKNHTDNLRQVPRSQSGVQNSNQLMTTPFDQQAANLLTNLLTLQTTMQNSDSIPSEDIQPYLKRIEQSPLVRTDPDLQKLLQRINDLCLNNNNPNPMKEKSPVEQHSPLVNVENQRRNPMSLPRGYLTKSRYISFLSDQTIRENWPKLAQRSSALIDAIVNQPIEFDRGTNLDPLIKQNHLEQYASSTRNAIEKSGKDYDPISYMMDSIVFDQMTFIGSREALIRPWDPSLLNRSSSKGSYPYPSGNGRLIERFPVDKDISLWMVETDESKPYLPTEFLPNTGRSNDKYGRIQQPQFNEIRQKRREDETRWNERYAFTKDNRTVLFVNDLRSYFMDYDTKRKYQVHDGVPINPVCRTGIAGRGDLPFWGPNHCVIVVLLRNVNDPEVVLMRHHDQALVLPKGFYGHEARYDNQIKIIQDPVSGQILPPNLFDYWWSNVSKLNENNPATSHLKRILNEKEFKEEFAEIFSQKGCNKSVFDNGYVDHPLNTDHAWVESSVWKIQLKDWRIPEMKSAKYAIADELKNANSHFPFVWMKLTDAILVVPTFDRGILVDVLATGMPL